MIIEEDWPLPSVEARPPARDQGMTANDVKEFISSFDWYLADNETIYYTFSEVVRNRKMFTEVYLSITANKLRDIVQRLRIETHNIPRPRVNQLDQQYFMLLKLADHIEHL